MPTPAQHLWRASDTRLVVLDDAVPTPRGTAPVVPPLLVWPIKDPADVLDYQLEIAPAIAGDSGDVISTIDVSIVPNNPGDLSLNSVAADGTRIVLWLASGQSGTNYVVTISAGLASGRTIVRSVNLPVYSLSSGPETLAALMAAIGVPIVDQNGNPILVMTSSP
jgi:hypothetical protein